MSPLDPAFYLACCMPPPLPVATAQAVAVPEPGVVLLFALAALAAIAGRVLRRGGRARR